MMDGNIAVESEYGKGSTFKVSFIQGLVTGGQTGIGKETSELLKRFQYASYKEYKNIERSWMPYGKVLVVDDMPVNLMVASGLLEPYGLKLDTATSGLEAIEKLSSINSNLTEERYDLIFMDHMMPGMDGIKAVRHIRNEISGVDTKRGIAATGGKEAVYIDVLAIFCKDVEDRLPLLQKVPDSDSLSSFVTQVHAIKSVSGSIGAAEISEEAAKLEAAGKAGDFALIEKSLGSFAERLAELVKNIRAALEAGNARANSETPPSENISSSLTPLLRQLTEELKVQNAGGINRTLEKINDLFGQQKSDIKTKEALEQISDQVLMAEYKKALEIINGMAL
jgi:CheY-like chemotaxis protein